MCQGFTLLELILSLTIIALIVVLIYGALRIGVRAWEKGGENVESRQRYRIVLNLIQHQLSSIYTDKVQNNGTQPFYLKGDSTSLEFISRISMVPGNSFGNVYVRYQVTSEDEKKSLAFYEKNIVLLTEEMNMDGLIQEDYYELIPEMYEFEFEYLKSLPDENMENQELSWLPVWEPENEKEFPLGVRIHFQADEMSEPLYVIIPIQKNENLDR